MKLTRIVILVFPASVFSQAAPAAQAKHSAAESDMEQVQASALFRSLAAQHPSVEAWADEGFTEGGWSYFWIVSRFDEASVRILAYVRLREGQFECRTYDGAGDDLWVKVE